MRLNNFIFRGCIDRSVYKSNVLLKLKSMNKEEPHREMAVLIMGNGRIITCRRHSRADGDVYDEDFKNCKFRGRDRHKLIDDDAYVGE